VWNYVKSWLTLITTRTEHTDRKIHCEGRRVWIKLLPSGRPLMTGDPSKKFLSPKICKIWSFSGPGDQGPVWNLAIFTAKGTSLHGSTSSEPFCVKIGWGVWPPEVSWKKRQKVTRGSHRSDVSPLTQGLRYRTACDRPRPSQLSWRNDVMQANWL